MLHLHDFIKTVQVTLQKVSVKDKYLQNTPTLGKNNRISFLILPQLNLIKTRTHMVIRYSSERDNRQTDPRISFVPTQKIK
jgi:hypothetical protein